jgi:phytoene desaturase
MFSGWQGERFSVKSVIIIGAGLGGLAAALRLRHMGFDVTVIEKQKRPGGRSNVLQEHGFRVDIGPTILVMKQTFDETYRAIGQDINQRIKFVALDPNYRIYYHDGTYIDLYNGMAKLAAECERIEPGVTTRLFRFIGEGAKKYELGMDFVVRNYDHIIDLANPKAAARLIETGAYQNLFAQAGKYFKTDKLRKAFTFHSMFLGLSPLDALAMYSLITYADLVEGMQFPMGGIYSVIEDMVVLADMMGVTLRTGTPVEEILIDAARGRVKGVRLAGGEVVAADIVVSNADLVYTYKHLVPTQYRRVYTDAKLDRMDYACSGYLLYLGVDKVYPHMRHQALYFSEDYRANLDAIFRTKTLPADPSFHLNNPTITDPSLAPPGHSVLYLLAPMPNLQGNVDWDAAARIVREKLLQGLERLVDPEIRRHIVWERQYRPSDWQNDINAPYGVAFGSLSHGFFQSSYFRPHNVARDIPGLYFVGQGTYPGIGMPMVMLSARLLAERLAKEQV